MTNYQILPCPSCAGRGCPVCKNTGRVKVSQEQLQKLKQMAGQLARQPRPFPSPSPPQVAWQKVRTNANLAGIIAFSILSILAGAAAASWYFLKSLKPFFAGFTTLLTLVGTALAWHRPFFQPQEPPDFLNAIKLQPQS